MSEPKTTGYGEHGDDPAPAPSDEDSVSLTTDDEAQRDDDAIRPGNEGS